MRLFVPLLWEQTRFPAEQKCWSIIHGAKQLIVHDATVRFDGARYLLICEERRRSDSINPSRFDEARYSLG